MKLFEMKDYNLLCGVYKITCPTGNIYVGQSCNIEVRFKYYRELRCRSQPLLFESLCKYGYLNHKFEILEECEECDLNMLERYYQELYDSNGVNGLNGVLCKGTKGVKQQLSDARKHQISIFFMGRAPVNRKKAQCTITGEIFKSIKDCATKRSINYTTLKQKLNGHNKCPSTYKYYIDETI